MHTHSNVIQRHIFILCVIFFSFIQGYSYSAESKPPILGQVHFLPLPIDHSDHSRGSFTGYYVVGPNQNQSQPPVFFLADGQMNMIQAEKDCSNFYEWLKGAPFILPCVRGFSPELLEKCKRNNETVDLKMARNVFASWQQVEDIEAIRQNLIRVGILPKDGKISVYGASGGGILAQEYVTKYPNSVHKLILESTGSPVIAKRNNTTLIRNLVDYDVHLAVECQLLRNNGFRDFEKLSYILYNLGRQNINAIKKMNTLVHDLNNGNDDTYQFYLKNPLFNLASQADLLKTTKSIGCRVRLCEIWEHEISEYRARGKSPINLGFEWVSFCLSDLINDHGREGVSAPSYKFDLSKFSGETLVIAGTEDVVFSPEMARSLAKSCKHSVMALLIDGHSMEKNWAFVCNLRREFLDKPLTSVIKDPQFSSVLFEMGQ